MTTNESAIYNRISTKCHAYMKYYLPTEYALLASQAEKEYKNRQSRRNSLSDIQKTLSINFNPEPVESTDIEDLSGYDI